MSEKDVNLKDLVQAVRRELELVDLARMDADRPALFELESLELELHFAVVNEDQVHGKIDLKVVSIGSDLGSRAEEVQKVKVTFRVAQGAIGRGVVGTRGHSQTSPGPILDVAPLDDP